MSDKDAVNPIEQGEKPKQWGMFDWRTFIGINIFSTVFLVLGWVGVDFLRTTSGVRYEYSFIGYNLAYLVRRLFGVMFEKKKFFEFE